MEETILSPDVISKRSPLNRVKNRDFISAVEKIVAMHDKDPIAFEKESVDLIDMVKHPSSISRHYSTGFVSIIFVILIGQIMITNVFGEMFGVEALSIKDWLFLFVTTSPVLLIGDTLRLLKNKIS